LLSFGGRFTLCKTVMGSICTYYMSMFKEPEAVLKNLEPIRARFFWGLEETERKVSWIKWDIVLNMKEK